MAAKDKTADKPKIARLPLDKIITDAGTQPREKINVTLAGQYALEMQDGDKFPPVVVFKDENGNHYLADGFHRHLGAKNLKFKDLEAEIIPGTLADAQLYASGANGIHGLNRTQEDKRRAVRLAIRSPLTEGWSDRQIAKQTHTSHPFVAKMREELEAEEKLARGEVVPEKTEPEKPDMDNQIHIGSNLSEPEHEVQHVPEPVPASVNTDANVGTQDLGLTSGSTSQGIWESRGEDGQVAVYNSETGKGEWKDPVLEGPSFQLPEVVAPDPVVFDPKQGALRQAINFVLEELKHREGTALLLWIEATLSLGIELYEEQKQKNAAAVPNGQKVTPGKATPKSSTKKEKEKAAAGGE